MSPSLFTSLLSQYLSWRRPLLLYAGVWTALLTATVGVAALSPEVAFIWTISPTSSVLTACGPNHRLFVRVPAELPSEVMCLPAKLFQLSAMDVLVPPIFAALVVGINMYANVCCDAMKDDADDVSCIKVTKLWQNKWIEPEDWTKLLNQGRVLGP
ncbi:hypothetical protein Cgig2_034058 [Carnegiea gigantea]|uniref:Uncharacterized protein n=1 Tax=Carnegiea gigantea TaxID=171969 RepID=A0A9Q1QJD7_9CARY|nr:hypothetical protein Cgig2_034058 [Carnegiea gigantea]